jgi:hypothetical protein
MREELDAPTLELPPHNVEELRAFLDAQSRFKLAVWVRHEQPGVGGPMYDHHLLLAVDDEDWETGDMRALEDGMRLPALDTREKTWIDIYPLSEVRAVCAFGTVLWEQTSPGDDPLDYRFTFESFVPDPDAVERFVTLVAAVPPVRSVGADVVRLWKGDDEVESHVRLLVEAPFGADVLRSVADAARASVLAGRLSHSAGLGRPADSMTILYEVVA